MRELMERYRGAFLAGDADVLAGFFAHPLQTVGVTPDGSRVACWDAASWRGVLDHVLAAYGRLGVADGELELTVDEPLAGVAHARAHWTLLRADGGSVYDFTAVYTVVDRPAGPAIVAVGHDEAPKLLAADAP